MYSVLMLIVSFDAAPTVLALISPGIPRTWA
jgi:hypothetical protein